MIDFNLHDGIIYQNRIIQILINEEKIEKMKKKIITLIPFVSILCLLAVSILGCSYFSPIIGKWQDKQAQDTIEFTRNGDIIIETGGHITVGTYELLSDEVIKVSFDNLAGDFISILGIDTWKYNVSGDTLTIQAGIVKKTYYKYGKAITNTSKRQVN